RLLRGLARALRIAAVILDQKLDVWILEFRERHLGGVLHGLRGHAGIGRRRRPSAVEAVRRARAEAAASRMGLRTGRGSAARRSRPKAGGRRGPDQSLSAGSRQEIGKAAIGKAGIANPAIPDPVIQIWD